MPMHDWTRRATDSCFDRRLRSWSDLGQVDESLKPLPN